MSEQTEKAVILSYLQAKESYEKKRREKSNIRMQIYNDDWLDVLDEHMRKIFCYENYDNLKLSKNISLNPTKYIVSELANVYEKGAVRSYGEDNKYNEKFEEILGPNFNMDEFMRDYNEWTFLLNDNMILVQFNEETELIELHVITPAVSSVIQDDVNPEIARAIYYTLEYVDSETREESYWVYWDDENHFVIRRSVNNDTFQAIKGNPDMENPYGVKPFVITRQKSIPMTFWNPANGEDMINGTIQLGINNSLKDHYFKDVSFKELYIIGADKDAVPAQQLRDSSITKTIPQPDADVKMFNLTPEFAQLNQDMDRNLDRLLNAYGLNVDSFKGVLSGVALEIRNRSLMEKRRKQIPIYRQTEEDLARMIAHVYNTHFPGTFEEGFDFKIDYPEMETFTDPLKKLEYNEKEMAMGLTNPTDIYKEHNPDITDDEQAEEKVNENLEAYKAYKNKQTSISELVGTVDE